MTDVDVDLPGALLGVALTAILSDELPPERGTALLVQMIKEVPVISAADVSVISMFRRRFAYRMGWWR